MEEGLETHSRETAIAGAENLTGYVFKNSDILMEALTHSSFGYEMANRNEGLVTHNERLEFLGDAVVGLVIARLLMERFPRASEGKLSRWRSSLVSRKTLAGLAMEIGLGDFLLLGKGERRSGGAEKSSILAGAIEALIGALYLDAGIEEASRFLEKIYGPLLSDLENGRDRSARLLDRKTVLQERTQRMHRAVPRYRVVESWGPEHEKNFRVEILINDQVVAMGDGKSKKEAEQNAASRALEMLEMV